MKFVIVGLGYVGLSLSVILAKNHAVIGIDKSYNTVDMLSRGISPLEDDGIINSLNNSKLNLKLSRDLKKFSDESVDGFIIAVPTDSTTEKGILNTTVVENVISQIEDQLENPFIVIKSTVPVGFTESMQKKYHTSEIIFAPEFLREGTAFHDNKNPSRIVVGDQNAQNKWFGKILYEEVDNHDVPLLTTTSAEAEAIKLFSNSYLALRVAFFNEVDTFSDVKNLNPEKVIEGISLDPRIGTHYNNPSFGFGGYCLPKDSEEMEKEFKGINGALIKSIKLSNELRINHMVDSIMSSKPKVVGAYKLAMKMSSENSRTSSIKRVIEKLQKLNVKVIVYDDKETSSEYEFERIQNFNEFEEKSDLIISNRMYDTLLNSNKIFTRDIYNRD